MRAWFCLLVIALAGCSAIDPDPVADEGLLGPVDEMPLLEPGAELTFLWAATYGANELPKSTPIDLSYVGLTTTHDEWGDAVEAFAFSVEQTAGFAQSQTWLFRAHDMRPLGIAFTTDEGPARMHYVDVGVGPFIPVYHSSLFSMMWTMAADDNATIGGWRLSWAPASQTPHDEVGCTARDIVATPTPRYAPTITVCLDESPVPVWSVWSWPDGRMETAQRVEGMAAPVIHQIDIPEAEPMASDPWLLAGIAMDIPVPPTGTVFGMVEPTEAMGDAISLHPLTAQWMATHPDAYMGTLFWFKEFGILPPEAGQPVGTALGALHDGNDRLQFSLAGGGSGETATFVPLGTFGAYSHAYATPPLDAMPEIMSPMSMAEYYELWPEAPNFIQYSTLTGAPFDFEFGSRQIWAVLECFDGPEPFIVVSGINGQLLFEGISEHQSNGACGWGWVLPWPPVQREGQLPVPDGATCSVEAGLRSCHVTTDRLLASAT